MQDEQLDPDVEADGGRSQPGEDSGFEEVDSDDIPDTDITFECPNCSKSLSIDQRGAGLVIACTSCHQLVTVPIPEGMEISDIDIPPAALETQIVNLRRSLAKAESRVAELDAQVTALKDYRAQMERGRARTAHRFSELRNLSSAVLRSQAELAGALDKIQNIIVNED